MQQGARFICLLLLLVLLSQALLSHSGAEAGAGTGGGDSDSDGLIEDNIFPSAENSEKISATVNWAIVREAHGTVDRRDLSLSLESESQAIKAVHAIAELRGQEQERVSALEVWEEAKTHSTAGGAGARGSPNPDPFSRRQLGEGDPTGQPTGQPSIVPSSFPTAVPSAIPTISRPTGQPTASPSTIPTALPVAMPTGQPTTQPSGQPSAEPSSDPTGTPTGRPTTQPSGQPSGKPSAQPTGVPSGVPSGQPTGQPSAEPSAQPTGIPTTQPTSRPTRLPTGQPSGQPTSQPTSSPSARPSTQPTSQPTGQPTLRPTSQPTGRPSGQPTAQPSRSPTGQPSVSPTSHPTTSNPTSEPSSTPTQYPNTSPPSNIGDTNRPTGNPTSQPTNYLDDFKYKQIYSLWSKWRKQLPLEIKPDNRSVIGSIYFDFLDYKGTKMAGDCGAWNEFRTKAVKLPFDHQHPSYIKTYWGVQNFEKGFESVSSSFADCGTRDVLARLFAALMSPDPSRRFTGRCVGTDGVFHDWRVYACNGNTVFCVDCKFACSDRACAGTMPTIVNSCDTTCSTRKGAYLALRADIEQSEVFPALSALNIVASDTSFEVQTTITEPAGIYCAALSMNLDGSEPVITSIYQVKKKLAAGIGFNQVTSVSGVQAASVFIDGLARGNEYRVFCYTEDSSLHGMDFNAVHRTGVTARTTGSNGFQIRMPSLIFADTLYGADQFTVALDNAPFVHTYFKASVTHGTLGDGCDASKATVGTSTKLPTLEPTDFKYEAGSTASSQIYHFSLKNSGTEGCFRININQSKKEVNPNTGDITYPLMANDDGAKTLSAASGIIMIVRKTTLLDNPVLSSVVFSRDSQRLSFTFNALTNRGAHYLVPLIPSYRYDTAFNCSKLVVFPGSNAARCQWSSDAILTASLKEGGDYPTIGSTVKLGRGTIQAKCAANIESTMCATYKVSTGIQTKTISAAANAFVPTVSLSTASGVGFCDDVVLDATQSTGNAGKDWALMRWFVRAADPKKTSVTSYLTPWSTYMNTHFVANTKDFMILPKILPGKLEIPLVTDIMVVLTLYNHLGLSSSTSAVFRLRNESLVPNVRIGGPVLLQRTRAETLSLFALAFVPKCALQNITTAQKAYPLAVSYRWGTFRGYEFMKALPSSSKDPKVFRIEPYSLESGWRYSITCVATVTQGLFSSESEARVVVDIIPAGVKAVIVGGDSRTISLAYDQIEIDASPSYDMDYPDGKYDTEFLPDQGLLRYNWTCIEYAPTFGNKCKVPILRTNRAKMMIDTSNLNANHTIYAGMAYLFRVKVTSALDASIIDTAATIATVIGEKNGPGVTLQITPTAVKYNAADKIVLTTTISANRKANKPIVLAWHCAELGALGDISLTPYQNKISLGVQSRMVYDFGIKPNMLVEGATYTFVLRAGYQTAKTDTRANPLTDSVLTLTDVSKLSTAQVLVTINGPPKDGAMTVAPTVGTAGVTEFLYLGISWSDDTDDLPLLFSFSYYKRGRSMDMSLISSFSEIPSAKSILPEGFATLGRQVTIFMIVRDIYDASAEAMKAVVVNPNTAVTLANQHYQIYTKMKNDLAFYFRTSQTLLIWHTINSVVPVINSAFCEGDPGPGIFNAETNVLTTCAQLNREKCTMVTNTCGPCLGDYVGIPGHHNSKCSLPASVRRVGTACQDNSQCFANYCLGGVCQDPPKPCPDNCGSFEGKSSGTCVFYKGNAVGKMLPPPEVPKTASQNAPPPSNNFPGTGVDDDSIGKVVNTSTPTSMPTKSPYVNPFEAVEMCTSTDLKCSAVCECNFGFYGKDCSLTNSTMITMYKIRSDMCTALDKTMLLQDSTLEVVNARFQVVAEILQDLVQVSSFALETCTRVLLKTITDAPIIVSHTAILPIALKTLTSVLSLGLTLPSALLTDIEAALEDLAVAKQETLITGEEGIDLITNEVRMRVSKIRFGGGNNLGSLNFGIPMDQIENFLAVPTTTVELTKRYVEPQPYRNLTALNSTSPNANAETTRRMLAAIADEEEIAGSGISTVIGISLIQHKNNPLGLETNSTPIQLKAFFYEGQAAGLASIANTTYKVKLQNRVRIDYQRLPMVVMDIPCFPMEKDYRQRVTCPDNSSTVVECIGDFYYGTRRVNCPSYEEVPFCLTYDGYGFMQNKFCKVTASDPHSTTCECDLTGTSYDFTDPNAVIIRTRRALDGSDSDPDKVPDEGEAYGGLTPYQVKVWKNKHPAPKAFFIPGVSTAQKHRRMQTASGWIASFEFASYLEIVGTNFESVYIPSGTQLVELVYFDKILLNFLSLFGVVFVVGLYFFSKWDISCVRQADPRYNEESKIIPTVRTFKTFFNELLPKEFAPTTMIHRFGAKLCDEHDWLVMCLPGWSKDRDLRSVKFLSVMFRVLNFMIAATILVQIFYWDNGDCQLLLDGASCEASKAIDGRTNLCWWSFEQRSCAFKPIKKRFAPAMIMTLYMVIMIALPDKLCNFLAKQAKRAMDRFYFGAGSVLTIDQELGDEMKDYQDRTTTILRAARLVKMKENIDFVNAEDELAYMTKITDSSHWLPRDHQPSKMNNFLRSVAHEAKNATIRIDDIGDPRSASELMWHALAGSRDLVVEKIQKSRRRAEKVKSRLAMIPLDIDKDNYLIKRFLADSLPGYRRKVAQHYLFIRTEVEETFAQQLDIFLKISMLVQVIYLILGAGYVAYMSTKLGVKSTEIWYLSVMTATIQDILVLQPLKIFVKYVLLIETIRDEMLSLYATFSKRAKSLIRRKRGLMTNITSLVQHFNPACRAARMVPHLPSARMIMSLTDFDLPVAHLMNPITPKRRFREPAIMGVGATPNASLFVATGASPLWADVYDITFVKLWIAWITCWDALVNSLFFFMSLSMHFLMMFNDVMQNVWLECLCTLFFNLLMLIYFYAQNQSNQTLLVYLGVSAFILLFPVWRTKVNEFNARRSKKMRIAYRDQIRARRYFKQYLEEGTFNPGEKARDRGIYFKEEGEHARHTYQKGTGDFDEEEHKLANEIFYEKGLLPYTAKLLDSPDLMGKRRSRPKEDRNKAGTKEGIDRQPYDLVSNVHAMKKGRKKNKRGESKVAPEDNEIENGDVQEAVPVIEEEEIAQTVLQRIKANAGGVLGSMLTISWGKLGASGKVGDDGAELAAGSGAANSTVITSKSGLKMGGLQEGSSFEVMDGLPLSPAKREPPARRPAAGSVGYGDVAKVDALHAMHQQNLHGFSKKNMAITLAHAAAGKFDLSVDLDDPNSMATGMNRSQSNIKNITDGWHKGEAAFDMSQSHFEEQYDKVPINLMAGSTSSNDTLRTAKSGKSHVTLIDAQGRERRDDFGQERIEAKIKKGIHVKEKKKEERAGETGSVVSKGPGEIAHKVIKGGHVVDHKAEEAKRKPGLEEEDSDDPSKIRLILPLRNALHELAALKVLNPTSGSAGAGLAQTNVDVNYKNNGGKWEEPKKPTSAGKPMLAAAGGGGGGGASVASGLTLKTRDQQIGSFGVGAGGGYAIGAGAGAAEFGTIRDKGRTLQFSRLKDQKAKVLKKLGNDISDIDVHEYPDQYFDPDAQSEGEDAAHRVYLTGVGFVPPKDPPAPVVPIAPKKVIQDGPADRLRAEHVDKPKYPLFH